jgi:WD40 repeat protein
VALSPDGAQLVAVRDGREWNDTGLTLIGWRTADWTVVYSRPVAVDLPELGATALAFAPDGQTLALGLGAGAIALYSAPDGRLLQTWRVPVRYARNAPRWHSLYPAFSPDGTLLAAAEGGGTDIWIWRAADGTLLRTLPAGPLYSGRLVFAPDGQTLAVGAEAGPARIVRVSDGTVVRTMQAPPTRDDETLEAVEPWAFSPDGALLLAASAPYDALVWRVSDGSPVAALRHSYAGLFAGNAEQVVSRYGIWSIPDGTAIANFTGYDGSDNVLDFAATPDGRWAAFGTVHRIYVWQVP